MAAFPELNPGPVTRVLPDGSILLANAAARELFGDDLIGHSWLDICPSVTDGGWKQVLRLASGETLRLEAAVGDRFLTFTYRRGPDGKSVFIYGTDITELRQAQELAAERESQLRELARFPDMNPGPVCKTDLGGTIVLANAACRALFGGDGLLGQCWKDVCPPVDNAVWESVLASTDIVHVEALVSGQHFVFQHRHDPETKLVFVYGTDVTQLRAAEDALRQSEKMATLGTLAAGVAHELNNPAAAAMRGADQIRDALEKLQLAQLQLGGAQLDQAGTTRLLEMAAELMKAARSAPRMLDAVARSDRETALEEWLNAHDVEEPWEYAPLLVSQGFEPETLAELERNWNGAAPAIAVWLARLWQLHSLVDEMSESTTRMSEIVKALKTYSYLGQAPIGPVDVIEGIESTLVMLRSRLKDGITVTREYEPDLPLIDGYGSELNQVWTNLIDNAADAMQLKGQLVIRVRQESGFICVEFEDSGQGMSDSVREHVFDPFFTTKPPGQGTGLGLSTSHNIVTRKHGGEISVQSRPGCTSFAVKLPIKAHNASAGRSSAEAVA